MQKRGRVAAGVIITLFAIIAAYVWISYRQIKPEKNRICEGILVDSVDIGGMTKEEAEKAVSAHIAQKENQLVQITVNDQVVSATLLELGYIHDAKDYTESAMKIGRTGNMIENYKEIRQASSGKIRYSIPASFDKKVLKKYIKKNCRSLCAEAENASIDIKKGEFVYGESKPGVRLNVRETMQRIEQAVKAAGDLKEPIAVVADVVVEQPKISRETAARCKEKLGTFSTAFNAGNVNRTKNLANAARLINGSVVYPGETFSVHDAISPLTEENGYYAAASYNNGKVEDSLGGGVCQVSTTLYNAVLFAELEIVERSPHSMVVSYVKPAMDAAIAGDYKDFKFRNNTEVPVYIQGGTYSGTIYFNIYGEETRSADRTITFESEITQTIEPGADKVTLDKTKPESYMSVTQQAHTGYKAILWKIVTENGKEIKTQINSSSYAASPRYVVKGTKKEEKKPEKTQKPTATQKPEERKKKTQPPATPKGGQTGRTDTATAAPAADSDQESQAQ